MLRQHAEKSCRGDAQTKVVLWQHAEKVVSRRYANGSRVKATRRKVVLRQYANRSCVKLLADWRHCTYATETVLKQYAKLSRLKKPGNGKLTLEACKETGQGDGRKKESQPKSDKGTGTRI